MMPVSVIAMDPSPPDEDPAAFLLRRMAEVEDAMARCRVTRDPIEGERAPPGGVLYPQVIAARYEGVIQEAERRGLDPIDVAAIRRHVVLYVERLRERLDRSIPCDCRAGGA